MARSKHKQSATRPAEAPQSPAQSLRRLETLGPALAIFAIALVAYIPALSAGFIWDDKDYVYENVNLRSFGGLLRIWFHLGAVPQYYPLTHSSFWIEHQLWGNHPAAYHIVNILLHAASSVVLWRLLRRLAVPGSLLAAMLFAVHPVHVESVAWITERKNVLSGLFYLLSFIAYWTAWGDPDELRPPTIKWKLYALSLGLFICALLSKTVTSSLPAAILLVLWYKRGKLGWRDVLPTLPMFVLGAVMGAVTSVMERNTVGAFGPDWELGIARRFIIAGRAVWFYASKLLWPVDLTFIYPRWSIDPSNLVLWAFPTAAIAVVVALLLLRRKLGRGPLVAALFFGGTLFPALGFINTLPMVYSFVADHFQYHASIGLIVLAAAALARYVPRRILVPVSVLWIAALCVLTFDQTRNYRDLRTLWLDTLAKNPNAWMAANNLASLYVEEAETAGPEKRKELAGEALRLTTMALKQKPDSLNALLYMGIAEDMLGNTQEAMARWQEIMDLRGRVNPRSWAYPAANAQFVIGRHYQRIRENDQAAAHFELALSIYPGHTNALIQLAVVETARGNLGRAYNLLESVLKQDLSSYVAWTNMANVQFQAGEFADAKLSYARAIELKPDHFPARYSLAMAQAQLQEYGAAERTLRDLLRDQPNSVDALAGLGTIYAKTGRAGEARELLLRALRIAPNHPQATRQLQQLEGAAP